MIKVLVVDDSSTSRRLLCHIVESAPDLTVCGEALNGREAVTSVQKLRPDVVLMDIVMPEMDGLDATSEIMVKHPTPIVMISGAVRGRETEMAFRAIKQGALTLLAKPDGPDTPSFDDQSARIISTVRAMSAVRVIHHASKKPRQSPQTTENPSLRDVVELAPEIVAMVSSTGGPAALSEVLQHLPSTFPLPVVIVQHIASDFLTSLMKWLDSVSSLPVMLAQDKMQPQPGHIYFAPVGKHLVFDNERRFAFTRQPVTHHIPSGDVLLDSVADQYGAAAVGVILTGMGADGASGLYRMRRAGAITIAQNEATSIVYGMPKEAVEMGAAKYSLALTMIAPMLRELATREELT